MGIDVALLRSEYSRAGLREEDVLANPLDQFQVWLEAAVAAGLPEPTAMTLATATPDGRPSARIVLLKGVDGEGFVFFTNYESRKGEEMERNPWVALVFYWVELERQVRVEGRIERVAPEVSDAYFASRPRGSRLGAWASPQSRVIEGRKALETGLIRAETAYSEGDIPRPPHWGGYRVRPDAVEFWQGRPKRLHDRLRYRREDEGWRVERLAP